MQRLEPMIRLGCAASLKEEVAPVPGKRRRYTKTPTVWLVRVSVSVPAPVLFVLMYVLQR
jgi:hypothetical protein